MRGGKNIICGAPHTLFISFKEAIYCGDITTAMNNPRTKPQGPGPAPGPGEDQIERAIRELVRLLKDQNHVPQQPQTSNGADQDESLSEQSGFEAAYLPEPEISRWDSLLAFLEHQRSKSMARGSADDLAVQWIYVRSCLQRLVFRSLGQLPEPAPSDDDFREFLEASNLCNIKYSHGPESLGSVWCVVPNCTTRILIPTPLD